MFYIPTIEIKKFKQIQCGVRQERECALWIKSQSLRGKWREREGAEGEACAPRPWSSAQDLKSYSLE